MKNSQVIFKLTTAVLSAGILFFSGCTLRGNPPAGQPGNRIQGENLQGEVTPDKNNPMDNMFGITNENPGTNPQAIQPQQLQSPQQTDMVSYKQKADNISAQVAGLKEVEEAHSVVIGNTCLVGYKPSRDSKNTESTRNLITNKVKSLDRTIDNVVVTESGDVIERIKKLSSDIAGNKPMDQINNEFMQLLKSIER